MALRPLLRTSSVLRLQAQVGSNARRRGTLIPIGVLGEIAAGSDAGRFVEVVDDVENTGGYRIMTYADRERSPEVYDAWAKSTRDVQLYFEESSWTVVWSDGR